MAETRRFKVGVTIHPQQCTIQQLRHAWRRADELGVDSELVTHERSELVLRAQDSFGLLVYEQTLDLRKPLKVYPRGETLQKLLRPLETQAFVVGAYHHSEFVRITEDVAAAVQESGVQEGMVLVSAMHITAGVWVNDDEPGIQEDALEWLDKIAPPSWAPPAAEVSRELDIQPSVVRQWKRRFEAGATAAVATNEDVVPVSALREAHQRIRELERLLGKKQMEIEILQAAQEVVKKSPWLRKGSGR